MVYDIILRSFKMVWTVSDISKNTRQWSDKQVDALSCNERCRMLNLNPVVVAKDTRKELKHSSLKCCSLMLNWLVN